MNRGLYRTEAIVLRARDYGEADLLLTLFSRGLGRLQAIAKGVRKPQSKLRAGVQPLMYAHFQLYAGRSTLYTVTQSESLEAFRLLREDLERLTHAVYLCELLDKMLPEQEAHADVFDLTLTIMYLMEQADPTILTHFFELRLASLLGYQPRLECCVSCEGPLLAPLRFSAARGGVLCRNCLSYDGEAKSVTPGTVALMNQWLKVDPRILERIKVLEYSRGEISDLLPYYLEYYLEKRLQTLTVINNLKQELNT
ncbi:MAG: DNA repair protein RecO [Firmicutes bacterium]|nr:DNA repair protein RecO [Bacillota bacterium]